MSKRKRRVALIDSDVACHQYAYSNEENTDWGDGVHTQELNAEHAIEQVEDNIQECVEAVRADDFVVVLSDKTQDNWRLKVLPTYKSTRSEKPALWHTIRQYLVDTYHPRQVPTLEGDDVLGILATAPAKVTGIEGTKIIVSIDKDFRTIPGRLYVPGLWRNQECVREPEALVIKKPDADRFHMYQTLTGDAVDNYKGCPGIGPKKAEYLLDTVAPGDWWSAIVQRYEKAGLTEGDALVQARVARICRHGDYDYRKKEVRLWNPPNHS